MSAITNRNKFLIASAGDWAICYQSCHLQFIAQSHTHSEDVTPFLGTKI